MTAELAESLCLIIEQQAKLIRELTMRLVELHGLEEAERAAGDRITTEYQSLMGEDKN